MIHPIDSILAPAGPESAPGDSFQSFFRKGQTVVRARPRLSWGYSEILVRCEERVSCKGPRCQITAENQHSVEFQIDYVAWIERIDAERVVGSLDLKRRLYEALEEFLISGLRRLLAEKTRNGDGLLAFYEQRTAIGSTLRDEIFQKYGIRIEPSIFPVLEEHLANCPIQLARIAVRPTDCNSHFDCSCHAELVVPSQARMAAILHFKSADQLKELFSAALKEAIAEEIPVDRLALEVHRFATENRLRCLVDEKLQKIGRELSFLSVELLNRPDLQEEREIRHVSNCTIGEFPIKVSHRLSLKLQNAGQYLRLRTDLETWVKSQLDDVSKSILFVHSIADLVESAIDYSGEIARELESRLSQIGYSVSQFSSLPELELRDWLSQGIRIGETFSDLPSNLHQCTVGVTVNGLIRFRTLKDQKMARYLQPNSPLPADLKQTIHAAIAAKVKVFNPLDFYLRFAESMNGIPSIQAQLRRAVLNDLEAKFSLEEEEAVLEVEIVKSGMQEKVNYLTVGPHTLDVVVKTVADGWDSVAVPYRLLFSLEIDSCSFAKIILRQSVEKERELEEIKDLISNLTVALLGTIPGRVAAYSGAKAERDRFKLEREIEQRVGPEVAANFGFSLRVYGLGRESTATEQSQSSHQLAAQGLLDTGEVAMLDARLKHDLREYDSLRSGLAEATAQGSDVHSEEYAIRRDKVDDLTKEHGIGTLKRRQEGLPSQGEDSEDFWSRREASTRALVGATTELPRLGEGSEP